METPTDTRPTAPDLTRGVPRSPFDEIEGFAWLPRMLDKLRAHHAGTGGDYMPFPCPGDRAFLRHFGLQAEAFESVVRGGADDATVGAWVADRARGDRATFRKSLASLPDNPVMAWLVRLYLAGVKRKLRQTRPDLDVSGITSLGRRLCVEEGHPLPGFPS